MFANVCENTVLNTLKFKENDVVVFKRGCGATVKDSIHISFLDDVNELTNNSIGNLMIADFGKFNIRMEKSLLIIENLNAVKTYKQVNEYDDLKIEFSTPH